MTTRPETYSCEPPAPDAPINHRVLSLDGGGAKGIYTLGFLSRLEKDLGQPIHSRFDLIYGTSTGSIIAALLSLGTPVPEIYDLYLRHIPAILKPFRAGPRSRALEQVAAELFGNKTWSNLKIPTGLVATNWNTKEPLVFKSHWQMAHGAQKAFLPGFGESLSQAICASCSAVPFFLPVKITLQNRGGEVVDAYDGGFSANNPSLFALIDLDPLKFTPEETVLFSVGVGHYPEPKEFTLQRFVSRHILKRLTSVQILTGVLEISSNTNGILQRLAMKKVRFIRADDRFLEPDLGTDLLETEPAKLRKLFSGGTRSYEKQERAIQAFL